MCMDCSLSATWACCCSLVAGSGVLPRLQALHVRMLKHMCNLIHTSMGTSRLWVHWPYESLKCWLQVP